MLAIIFVENKRKFLKKLFTSSNRVKILEFFLFGAEREYYPREVESITGIPYTAIRRELKNLKEIGLVTEKRRENHSYYCLNSSFFLLAELKVIFLKVKRKSSLEEELERVVSKISFFAPEKIVLFKDLVQGKMGKNSEIALLIVGRSKKKFWERVQELMENLQPQKAVTLLYLTPQEFKALSDSGNPNFHQILKEGKVIYEWKEGRSD